jgi:hypothetical protein
MTTPAIAAPSIWHLGFAVLELEPAMEEFGKALSLEWREPRCTRVLVTGDTGATRQIEVHSAFSAGGPPAIELFEAVPGTPLIQPQGAAFHHIGYWAEDVAAEKVRLEALGWPCVAWSAATPTSRTVALHRGPLGMGLKPCAVGEDRPHLRDLFPPTSPFHGVPEVTLHDP